MKDLDAAIADFDRAISLDPQNAQAYHNRGWSWRIKRAYEKAIADYSEAIRIDPTYAWAYNNRGIARRDQGEWDRALTDFDESIRLDPKVTYPHYNRAALLFLTHRDGAADEAQAVLKLQDWRGDLSMYAVLLGQFAARRDGQDDRARMFLDEAKARCDAATWPYPIIGHLRGEIDEATLLGAATSNDKMTEVRCFLGLKELEKGRKEAAEEHFRWVKEHGNPVFHPIRHQRRRAGPTPRGRCRGGRAVKAGRG